MSKSIKLNNKYSWTLMGVIAAALLIFGPLLSEVGRLRLRTATRRLRRDASCLVWVAPDG